MKTFCILESYTKGEIEDQVSDYMAKGWFPFGPVEVTQHRLYRVTVMYLPPHQAAVTRTPPEPETIH